MQEEGKEKSGSSASLQKYDESTQTDLLVKAETWIASGLLPSSIKKPEQAVVIALKGKELGLETMASFELIDVIMGKPALKPKLLGL